MDLNNMRKNLRKYIIPLDRLSQEFKGMNFQSCLDVGCGTGLWAEYLLENKIIKTCRGIEIYPKYFRQTNNLIIDSEDNTPKMCFDLICFFDVLHHVVDKDRFIHGYLEKYGHDKTVVFIKEMSPKYFFYRLMNRLHDLVMAKQLIQEISADHLDIVMKDFALIKQGEDRILWYDHYWKFYQKVN